MRPETLCMAPWTHTYLSPQTERRMCCASREPAQNFEQYIDTAAGTGQYIPITLDEHWNSEHMNEVRRKMLLGETVNECKDCYRHESHFIYFSLRTPLNFIHPRVSKHGFPLSPLLSRCTPVFFY